MDPPRIALYLVVSLVVIVDPGPGMLYVISRGLTSGRRAGVVAALGTSTGIAVHIVAACVGITAILQVSEVGFQTLKWVGVFYLLFLAWEALVTKRGFNPQHAASSDAFSVFWKGALVNALNPKVALFFLAYLPQFVTPRLRAVPAQMFLLGTVFLFLTAAVFTFYGLASALIRRYLLQRPKVQRALELITGSFYLLIGFGLALATRSR